MKPERLMNCLFLFLFFFTSAGCGSDESEQVIPKEIDSEDPVNGVRIAWDYPTRRKLSPSSSGYSGYARMIRLSNGNLSCVFENDGKIQWTQSADNGDTWSTPVTIASGGNGIAAAVPEVLQLKDNSILVSYNMRPGGAPDISRRFEIRIIRSVNEGVDWSDAVTIYQAGHEFQNGCWEPAQIQLPSGEIQLFIANEGPYTSSNEQEITLFRSQDNGVTWTAGEKVSFRGGHRDGMPVPLVLEDKGEIIFSIEDNGIAPTEFKPAIIRTSLANSWQNAPVSGQSSDREQPMDKMNRIAGPKYAGAPYIRRLHSGEVILSYQGNEMRSQNIWDRSDLIVCIGDTEGRNFNRKSRPFYFTDPAKTCLWNSLSVIDENTVVALGSTNAYGNKSEVWMIKGHVFHDMRSPKKTVIVDGKKEDDIWNTSKQIFIGGYGETNGAIRTSWDESNLYVLAEVKDNNVFSGNLLSQDGLRIYIDPANRASIAPDSKIFSIGLSPSGAMSFQEGRAAQWETKNASGINVKTTVSDSGYVIEAAIPWNTIGGMVATGKRIGFHACLYASSNGTSHEYEEPIAGNINNAPYTWSTMILE
jgi:hypothetical protein